jgi:methylmalonyl-CoA mutase N-terminal domain/subunit
MQNEIQNAAYEAQKAIERGEQIVVGVNQYQVQEQVTLERLQVDPAIEAAARKRLEQVRTRRDAGKAAELMGQLEASARGDQNMMPLFVECVENDVTLGEICGALRAVWGEYEARAF